MPNGKDPNATQERYEGDTQERSWDANVKALFDDLMSDAREHRGVQLTASKRSQTAFDKLISDAQEHSAQLRLASLQSLNDAIGTANLVGKAAVMHGSIAAWKLWGLEPEEAVSIAKILAASVPIDAIAAAVAAKVIDGLAKTK